MKYPSSPLRWFLAFGAILLASFLLLVNTANAFGCDTRSNGALAQCVPLAQVTTTVVATSTTTPTLTVTPTLASGATTFVTPTLDISPTATVRPTFTLIPTPRGDNPETARTPMWVKPEYCIEAMCPGAVNAPLLNSPGNWDWIPANSSIWYKMDDGHSMQMQLWVFANGQGGLSLDVFAPEQKNWWEVKPVGRGALNKNFPGADLFYSGRSQAYGVWYARLTNNNNFQVNYSFRYTRTTPTLGNTCDDCHKIWGYDWDACSNGSNSSMCEKLFDLYQTNPQCYSHNVDYDLANGCK